MKESRTVGYVRVSTSDQAQDGISLDNQAAKIRAYAELKGLDLIDIIIDAGQSGKTLDRPGMNRLMDLCNRRKISHVVVYKLDRLTRSTKDLLGLVEDSFNGKQVEFHSIQETIDTSTAQGRFFLTIIGAMAQMEREQIAERTRDALSYKKANYESTGTIPHGYILAADGVHIQKTADYKAVSLAAELKRQGLALRTIAEQLENAGYVNKNGRRYNPKSIRAMIQRAEYDNQAIDNRIAA